MVFIRFIPHTMKTYNMIFTLMTLAAVSPLMAQPTTPVQQESTLQTLLNAGQDYSEHRAREKRIERHDERRDRERDHHRRRNRDRDNRHRHHHR